MPAPLRRRWRHKSRRAMPDDLVCWVGVIQRRESAGLLVTPRLRVPPASSAMNTAFTANRTSPRTSISQSRAAARSRASGRCERPSRASSPRVPPRSVEVFLGCRGGGPATRHRPARQRVVDRLEIAHEIVGQRYPRAAQDLAEQFGTTHIASPGWGPGLQPVWSSPLHRLGGRRVCGHAARKPAVRLGIPSRTHREPGRSAYRIGLSQCGTSHRQSCRRDLLTPRRGRPGGPGS